MHLKTLTMKGFKSFASSTTLRLEPGITAVVGPNGSGKSNVVDALTWVMGEQGAKNLRGGSMADVIFAGAGSRPALGRAEVSLTIDNTDGQLPIDYTEVTVTRTLFRGGGSEYQINGAPCRLLDVQELLSDTGLGRQMHVIVGQGRLDAVLQATPEERRGFIEEAAGVLKHRRRKERALRKLDSMAGDLARLKDLTAELRRQLGPLARQAAVARRAQSIQIELRDATARLLADDVVQAQALLQACDADQIAIARSRAEAEEEERAARSELARLAALEAHADQRVAQAHETWQTLNTRAQAFSALADVAQERARGLASIPAPTLGKDPEELERAAQRAQEEEAELRHNVEEAYTALQQAQEERLEAEKADVAANQQVDILQRQLSDIREKIARAGGRVASARSRHEAALSALAQAHTQLTQAQQRLDTAQSDYDAHCARTGVDRDIDTGSPTDADAQARAAAAHEEASAALTAAREAVTAANDARREAASDRATWTSRRDTLAMSLRAQDATAQLAGSSELGVLGAIADAVTIERGWENALAALLGERATAAVMRDDDSAVQALTRSHEENLGALRLVMMNSAGLPPKNAQSTTGTRESDSRDPRTTGTTDPAPIPGHAARPLIQPRPHLESDDAQALARLLSHLLAHCWVVEDLAQARLLRHHQPLATVATRAGDVLAPGWATSSGSQSSSILELTAAYEEADAEAQAAAQAESQAQAHVDAARQHEERARQKLAQALAELRAADAEAAKVAQVTASLSSALQAAREDVSRAQRVVDRAQEEKTQRTAELAEATAALAALDEHTAQETTSAFPHDDQPGHASSQDALAAQLDTARLARESAATQARQARTQETEARLTLRTAEERDKQLRGRADSLRAAARRERQAREAAAKAQARRSAQLALARQIAELARHTHERAMNWVVQAASERDQLTAERSQTQEALSQVRERIDASTRRIAELTDAAHRDDVARAEQRMRLDNLSQRVMDELGMDLDTLVEEYGPHLLIPQHGGDAASASDVGEDQADEGAGDSELQSGRPYIRAEQEKRLARAKRDLERLGKVNPLALEEHAALEQRHQFLAEQLADLTRSRDDLLQLIEEIDARVLEVFTAAWQDTAREFEGVFSRLFPGGEGKLTLTDPSNMLTTGIDIHARPAGKKVTRLSLLSGGERSLAAVALLVAIFKARPSPFYVMDEVEAALDDTNLGRLLDIFTELRQSSQLIIITHQKRTMEVADALYGVTMRQGVTQVVSQKLAREAG